MRTRSVDSEKLLTACVLPELFAISLMRDCPCTVQMRWVVLLAVLAVSVLAVPDG